MCANRKRGFQFNIYLSESENKKLESILKKSKLTRSAYFRKCILNQEIRTPPTRDYKRLYTEINKIGTNINQIVRLCNQGEDLRLFADQLLFYMDELYALLGRNI